MTAFFGKLICSGAPVDRSSVDEIMGALLWVRTALEQCRERLAPEGGKQVEVLGLEGYAFYSIGLHCWYVRRQGGSYMRDY